MDPELSAELSRRKQALLDEFDLWRNQSNPHAPLAKHNTQLVRITTQLTRILNDLPDPATGDSARASATKGVQFVQSIWGYFQAKLALRTAKLLQNPLRCTDEYAWECYRLARNQALAAGKLDQGSLREPPLTFFSGAWAPFIQRRGTFYEVEGVLPRESERFDEIFSLLPIPVIGIPWSLASFAPASVAIAHEIGHAVEVDFQVAQPITEALDALSGLSEEHRMKWKGWRAELFADLYGVLCAGPAYVALLIDYLPSAEEPGGNDGHKYPPHNLRVAFSFSILAHLGLKEEQLVRNWQQRRPVQTAYYDSELDRAVDHLAYLFLTVPLPKFGDEPITSVVAMTAEDWVQVQKRSANLFEFSFDEDGRFRRTFAAAAWSYAMKPEAYAAFAVDRRLFDKLSATISGTVRGPEQLTPAEKRALSVKQTAADSAKAGELLRLALEA